MNKLDYNKIKVVGQVTKSLPNAYFTVKTTTSKHTLYITATTSGKMKKCSIRILVGDEATVMLNKAEIQKTKEKEFSVKGIIILRHKKNDKNKLDPKKA